MRGRIITAIMLTAAVIVGLVVGARADNGSSTPAAGGSSTSASPGATTTSGSTVPSTGASTDGAGVDVCLFEHSPEHGTPDAVFPNNWFSTHAAGEAGGGVKEPTLVYYPLKCPNRQAERREDAMRLLEARLGFGNSSSESKIVDLSPAERGEAPVLSGALAGVAGRRPGTTAAAGGGADSKSKASGKFFEGTGVLVLDRVNGVAYVSVSERAHLELAHAWADSVREREREREIIGEEFFFSF